MGFQVLAYPTYQPAVRIISNITNANPAVVTTTFAAGQVNSGNQYQSGITVRLDVPASYGMLQANGLFGQITMIDSNDFSINIDTTLFAPFSIPAVQQQYAQCVPIADSTDNTFPGSVTNVLPYAGT